MKRALLLFIVAATSACWSPGGDYGKFAGAVCDEPDECSGADDPPTWVKTSCMTGASVGGSCPAPDFLMCTIECTSDDDCAALTREPGRDPLKCLPSCTDGGPASVCGEGS